MPQIGHCYHYRSFSGTPRALSGKGGDSREQTPVLIDTARIWYGVVTFFFLWLFSAKLVFAVIIQEGKMGWGGGNALRHIRVIDYLSGQ